MQLRQHLSTGIWAVADKALIFLNGFTILLVVIAVLPSSEWAAFSLFQSIFLIICVLADSIFLQPMVKFASEHEAEVEEVLAASFNLYLIVMLVSGAGFAIFADAAGKLFASPELGMMLPWLPLLLALNIFRNVGIRYLQISYKIPHIFWIDLAFFGSITLMTILANSLRIFHTAMDFVTINIIGSGLSSIVAIIYGRKAFREMPLLTVPRNEYGKLLSFAKFQAGTSALLTFQQWADVLIVGVYAPAYVALYSAAKTLYRFFDAVREGATLLIVPVASRLHTSGDGKKLSELVEKLLFLAFAVLVPISLILALGANMLMDIFYKGKFPGITPVFEVLILTGFTLPLALVATNVLIGIGRVKGLFLSVLGGTIIFFAMNRLLVPQMNATGAALSVLASTTATGIFAFIAMRRELSITAAGILRGVKSIRNKEKEEIQ
ncbi:MAG: oligosaccharide flippase family protein [Bacteroidota bacterium]|nr:oligosaccharide flippase family protein [Bacteroidota bacterium]MDP4231454.1 oligosaccharide flippase family protein [Bacteroidota bacterium]MDP4235002.1 oligosaccharide flippase family protein [Bacteroidota bacterium]